MVPIYPIKKGEGLPKRLLERSQLTQKDVTGAVNEIIANVRANGDAALVEYAAKFDRVSLTTDGLRVAPEEVEAAYKAVDPALIETMKKSRDNIIAFHEKQLEKTWVDFQSDSALGQLVRPIAKVGVYVPGGTAPLSSSVLMNVLPAKVAGVKRIAMCTPPQADGSVNPAMLVAADLCGVKEIYKVGGAQAIAALAFGTETIAPVDKIVGPGNIYVANAKRAVYGYVGIDMVAGPSEVLIIADETANPRYVAADLLSQAEHDKIAAAMLITTSEALAKSVQEELPRQLAALPRQEIAAASLENNGAILLAEDLDTAFDLANRIAPEHLELSIADAFSHIGKVENAGACFVGHYSPEPLGDYFAGPNHVLPTSGTARFFSPLNVEDFLKKTSIVYYSREKLQESYRDIERFALAEYLDAHARSAVIRFEDEN